MTTTIERDEQKLHALIEQHLPLVRHVVFQVAVHFPRHVDREELATAGALGLVEAARRYDESRGVPFDRFAAQRIRGAILDAVRAADWAPRSVRTLARKLEAVEQRLATELGRVPNVHETAEALGMKREELSRLQDRMFRSVVLALEYEVSDADEELTLVDVLADDSMKEPPEELETRELHSYLRDAVNLLPERHRLVIVGYFLEGRKSQDLAQLLGVTESRISPAALRGPGDAEGRHRGPVRRRPARGAAPAGWPAARPATPAPSPRPATGTTASAHYSSRSSGARTLLWPSRVCFELSVELAGDVALEAATDLPVGPALGSSAFDVGTGGGVVSHALDHDDVERSVELTVAARLSRWRVVWPEEAGMGATPARLAKAASLRQRSVWDQAQSTVAATMADALLVEQVGSPGLDDRR